MIFFNIQRVTSSTLRAPGAYDRLQHTSRPTADPQVTAAPRVGVPAANSGPESGHGMETRTKWLGEAEASAKETLP